MSLIITLKPNFELYSQTLHSLLSIKDLGDIKLKLCLILPQGHSTLSAENKERLKETIKDLQIEDHFIDAINYTSYAACKYAIDNIETDYLLFLTPGSILHKDFIASLSEGLTRFTNPIIKPLPYDRTFSYCINASYNESLTSNPEISCKELGSFVLARSFLKQHTIYFDGGMIEPYLFFLRLSSALKQSGQYIYLNRDAKLYIPRQSITSKEIIENKAFSIQAMLDTSAELSIATLALMLLDFVETISDTKDTTLQNFIGSSASKLYRDLLTRLKPQAQEVFNNMLCSFASFDIVKALNTEDLKSLCLLTERKESYSMKLELSDVKDTLECTARYLQSLKDFAHTLVGEPQDKDDFKSCDPIYIVSVVNNEVMYNKYFVANPFLRQEHIKLCPCYNFAKQGKSSEIKSMPYLYNKFIQSLETDGWVVFCHNDLEFLDDISKILSKLDKQRLYGVSGAITQESKGQKVFCYFSYNDHHIPNSNVIKPQRGNQKVFDTVNKDYIVDTLDCVCLICHSSLIKKYNLTFDEVLRFDLVVEDFCINAKVNHGIISQLVDINCIHHSNSSPMSLPQDYIRSLDYLGDKYKDVSFAGTCSMIGGLNKVGFRTYKDLAKFY